MSNEIVPAGQNANNELSNIGVYDRIADPMQAVKTLGMAIFKSGIFNVDKPEIGEVIAMECLAQRKSPLELARTYHFVEGRLAIKSDALLAKFQMAGGKVDWVTRTDKLVEADFYSRTGAKVRIVASIEEYMANGVAYGKDGKLKHNWKAWPRRMLTARAIAEGVRLMAPEAAFGTYTVEELDTQDRPRPAMTVVPTLDDIVPEFQRGAAVRVLRKVGHLTEEQDWADIPEELAATLSHPKRGGSFLAAVKEEYEKNI